MTQIDRSEGGGPWTDENQDPLDPGDSIVRDYERDDHGKLRPWTPMDSIQVKNFDASNRIYVEINGQYTLVVEPNAAETFTEAGVIRWRITNKGGGTIDPGDVVVSASVDPYDADDAAKSKADQHPIERMIRGTLNL